MEHTILSRVRRHVPWLAALFLWTATAAFAQAPQEPEADPPGRVANLSYRQGSVVFAPEGDEEWVDLPVNRPLTRGDRLWSDKDARAELHLGTAAIQVDGESHIGVSALEDNAAQFILMQGSVNARVRELAPGENFEIDTPNLAFRAQQPGDFRIDVDAGGRETRIVVRSGSAVVFGEGGQSVNIGAGEQMTFAGRFLAQVQQPAHHPDAFDQFAAERNRAEDASVAARHVPRGVVGYPQLDQHGTWAQDPTYGEVWYPQVTVQDWAPYRYGRWDYIAPWGWTWIDDAPWGFAPFHYGRWAQIGPRWAWVPGRIAPRPLYAPALVAFIGGSGGSLTIASGPGVGWYPLGPGEAWYPSYRYSARYLSSVNPYVDLHRYHRDYYGHMHRQRPYAVTAVREDDFRHGRPVRNHWRSVSPSVVAQSPASFAPVRPDRRDRVGFHSPAPRLQATPPRPSVAVAPSRSWGPREGWSNRERAQAAHNRSERQERADRNDRGNDARRGAFPQQQQQAQQQRPQQFVRPAPAANPPQLQPPRGPWNGGQAQRDNPAVREQARAQREQNRLQADAEHDARQQMRHQQWQRQQQQQRGEQAARQMQERQRQNEQAVRHMQERQQRDQREAWQRQRQDQARMQAPGGAGFGAPQMHRAPEPPAMPISAGRGDRGERQPFHRADNDRGRGGGGREGRGGDGRFGQRGDDQPGHGRGRGG